MKMIDIVFLGLFIGFVAVAIDYFLIPGGLY